MEVTPMMTGREYGNRDHIKHAQRDEKQLKLSSLDLTD